MKVSFKVHNMIMQYRSNRRQDYMNYTDNMSRSQEENLQSHIIT